MKKAIVVLFVLLLAALLVTACGGGNTAPAAPTSAPAAPTAAPLPAGDVAKGTELYNQVCVACHGPGGIGVQGLGKDMTTSTFIAGLSDAELLEFVKKGRSVSDPLNTTGVDMPPKGGNPALTDAQLIDIIAYMRSIHK
ncbi:MAG: cytochrome c [Caldilineales bacterium]|nr:cytochrome c [Caldilineales bacterium]